MRRIREKSQGSISGKFVGLDEADLQIGKVGKLGIDNAERKEVRLNEV